MARNKSGRSAERAAKRSGSEDGADMKKFYIVLGVVAVIGIGAVGFSALDRATSNAATAPVEVEGLDDPQTLIAMARGVEAGNPDAKVAIWEFGDFQCPACGVFAGQVKPQVDLAYVESGMAKMVFFDYPLNIHQHAFLAARAARCAEDQDAFWAYHDELFGRQNDWAFVSSPAGQFVDIAVDLGLDRATFQGCLDSDAHADVVTANMRLGQELRVNSTPTIMVVPEGGMPIRTEDFGWPAIQEAVTRALEQQ